VGDVIAFLVAIELSNLNHLALDGPMVALPMGIKKGKVHSTSL
jgi:hypothetical protein